MESPLEQHHRNYTISVVIPCYNASQTIGNCLHSLLQQTYAPQEIIVVNDASTDDAIAVIAAFNVQLINCAANGGAATARAIGAAKATGDIIAFIDADCRAPQDWLEKIVGEFQRDPTLGGVGGKYSHPVAQSTLGHFMIIEEEYAHFVFSKNPDQATLPGGNCAFLRTAWKQNKTQQELSFFKGMASGEDTVICHELRQSIPLKFVYALEVFHQERNTKGYLKRHLHRGISRVTILLNGLSDQTESGITLLAYGGRNLLLSALLLGGVGVGMLTLPIAAEVALPLTLAALVGHYWLSREFFGFVRRYVEQLLPSERPSRWSQLLFRPLLSLRLGCWLLGGSIGLGRYLLFRVRLLWNIACSILHFWRPGRISKLFYFVTSKCNARCSFCFNLENVVNWQERKPSELTLDEVTQIAQKLGRLPYLTLSGGEPFIREDLPQLVHAFWQHSHTQWVTIPSNAALTERVLRSTVAILNQCPGIFLTVQVSIDSMYEDHDHSRKIKDGFAKMTETLKALSKIRHKYQNLRIQIATCYAEFNLHRIEEIIDYCQRNFKYDQQMFYLIREVHALITTDNKKHIWPWIDLLQRNEQQEWQQHRQSIWSRAVRTLQGLVYNDIIRIITREEFIRPCYATQKFVTLYDDGSISPCEVLEKTNLGNIKDFNYDFYQLKRSQKVNQFHQQEIVNKQCNCDWMCATPINMLYDLSTYKNILMGLFRPDKLVQLPQSTRETVTTK
ncbi:hypothetical protein DO97_14380 [Neosynechococcus sphagnicola sy1]|uniref:Radical SAM core domain-containing protein n=1 Tax=Neosynechococcus sphagnicola sy1 TaxID=1497020 RepID=A0A098TIK4_9CYAN|nr:glycosyltransferase [Neosynechococcus sphagnicola]KGF71934.1 hypothetical protein DO97_14380 [Neosynechococcus sphagnicola sy1]